MTLASACALAIGGIDPGGGAGIIADLRAFEAAGVFGCAAVAVITVQSTAALRAVRPVPARLVSAQANEVIGNQRVCAIKVGALGTRENARAVARLLERNPRIPAVVDTPILPSRGRGRLLQARALTTLRDELLPQAALVTVNADELEMLLGTAEHPTRRALGTARQSTAREARDGALALARLLAENGHTLRRNMGGAFREGRPFSTCGVLLKGGHLQGELATDVLVVGDELVELSAPRLQGPPVHGKGCTFASLIAGRLARLAGDPSGLAAAARWAKRVHYAALARSLKVGYGMRTLVFEQR